MKKDRGSYCPLLNDKNNVNPSMYNTRIYLILQILQYITQEINKHVYFLRYNFIPLQYPGIQHLHLRNFLKTDL